VKGCIVLPVRCILACRVVVRPISSIAVFVPVRVAAVTTAATAAVSTAAVRHDWGCLVGREVLLSKGAV
jgi:hypothetical protein